MAVQIGPKIGIEGEKEYRSQISQIIQQTKALDSAMEATSSAWNENTSAMTKNKAQAQQVAQKIELTQQRLTVLNSMLEQSAAKYGENSTVTLRWQQAVDSCTASLNSMQQQLKSFNGAENFSELSTKFADMGTTLQNIGDKMTAVGQKMTMSLTLPIMAVGTAAVKLGSDLEESANKVDVVFGNMSGTVKDFASTTTQAFAISEGKALEMAGDYGAMATSMGMSQAEAAKLSTNLVALAGDMASFHNKSTEIAANSLKGVFTGETESLKQFGVAMTETNLEHFAEKHGKVYDQMSQAERIMTRYSYLLETQSDAVGDAERTMDGFAGSTRQLKAALEDAGAALGQALVPIITPLVQMITKLLTAFASLPAPIQTVIAVIMALLAAIGPIIVILGTLVSSFGTLVAAAPAVASAITAVAAAVTGLDLALAPAIGVILAIVAAFALAFAAGAALAANWDSIADAASNLGTSMNRAVNTVKQKLQTLVNSAASVCGEVIAWFASLPAKIANALRQAVDRAKQEFEKMVSDAKKSGKDFINGFVDGIKSGISKIVDTVKDIAETIDQYLGFSCPEKGPLSKYEIWMPDFMKGLAKGIYSNEYIVARAMNSLSKTMALPLDSNATMNMALSGANGGSYSSGLIGGTIMNISVDHISELNDLIRIQNQAQQRLRMGAR